MAIAKRTRSRKSNKTEEHVTPVEETRPTAETHNSPIDVRDAIRHRAYELYLQRGCQHGCDFDDWLRAETEVLGHFESHTA